MKFATKLYDITHLTLNMLLHYLGKLKIQISCRYSAHKEDNANKLHFKCTNFNSSERVFGAYLGFIIKILFPSLNTMLIVDKHCCDVCCDNFRCQKLIAKVNKYKNGDMENFICNQYGEKLAILNTENMEICV